MEWLVIGFGLILGCIVGTCFSYRIEILNFFRYIFKTVNLTQLCFGYTSYNGFKNKLHKRSEDKHFAQLELDGRFRSWENSILYTTTRVSKSFFSSRDKHLVLLRCRSEVNLDKVISYLSHLFPETVYKVVVPSPGFFWVFVDYIGTLKECFVFAEPIEGLISNHMSNSKVFGAFISRAHPSNFAIPDFSRPFSYGRTSDEFGEWFRMFQEYWESDSMERLLTRRLSLFGPKEEPVKKKKKKRVVKKTLPKEEKKEEPRKPKTRLEMIDI